MPDPFVAVDAGRLALEHRRVYRPHHFLLLREHFLGELRGSRGTRANRWPCIPSTRARPCASAPSLNFSSVEMMPRISPMTSLVPATALYQRSSGYSLGMWQSWHVARTPVRFAPWMLSRCSFATHCIEWHAAPQNSSVPVTWTITWVPMIAMAPTTKPRATSARTDQRALGLRSRRHARVSRPGWPRVPFACGFPAIAPQGFAGGGGGMSTTGTVGLKAGSRSAIWPWRAKSIDSPRMRAASCGAWKPVEFSASTKSR